MTGDAILLQRGYFMPPLDVAQGRFGYTAVSTSYSPATLLNATRICNAGSTRCTGGILSFIYNTSNESMVKLADGRVLQVPQIAAANWTYNTTCANSTGLFCGECWKDRKGSTCVRDDTRSAKGSKRS